MGGLAAQAAFDAGRPALPRGEQQAQRAQAAELCAGLGREVQAAHRGQRRRARQVGHDGGHHAAAQRLFHAPQHVLGPLGGEEGHPVRADDGRHAVGVERIAAPGGRDPEDLSPGAGGGLKRQHAPRPAADLVHAGERQRDLRPERQRGGGPQRAAAQEGIVETHAFEYICS
ncbi:hypothetical protein Salmuc_01593 [Salipiger mucosus DSM 16094]|uniref:Uncharacterized protein n=1 Tax=Salipiger mucosus DSM 16094 TaxID=1123237 RepID=S9S6Y6_9RHOB|nr:hypothetical protein Salmuc_01593 [Salipiger mucosus DSM 16094]